MGQITSILQGRANVQSASYQKLGRERLPEYQSKSYSPVKDLSPSQLAAALRPIYTRLFDKLNVDEPERYRSEEFKTALLKRIAETPVPCKENTHSWQCMMVGFAYIDFCLPYHPLQVKIWAAMYSWLSITLDDAPALGIVDDIQRFQERWLKGEKQPSPLLETYADIMREAYDHYDAIVANLIVSASFNLLSATCTEARDEFRRRTPSKGGQAFPMYLRERNGDAEAFGYFPWCREMFGDLPLYMESMPDMMKFLNLGNDVLSFYKEELAGDSDNYIHSIARYENKDVYTVLDEVATETVDAVDRINQVFEGKGEYEKAWRFYVRGYIGMHKTRARYRLWEVGVGHKPFDTEKVVVNEKH